jgi:hypothetical protein
MSCSVSGCGDLVASFVVAPSSGIGTLPTGTEPTGTDPTGAELSGVVAALPIARSRSASSGTLRNTFARLLRDGTGSEKTSVSPADATWKTTTLFFSSGVALVSVSFASWFWPTAIGA